MHCNIQYYYNTEIAKPPLPANSRFTQPMICFVVHLWSLKKYISIFSKDNLEMLPGPSLILSFFNRFGQVT